MKHDEINKHIFTENYLPWYISFNMAEPYSLGDQCEKGCRPYCRKSLFRDHNKLNKQFQRPRPSS